MKRCSVHVFFLILLFAVTDMSKAKDVTSNSAGDLVIARVKYGGGGDWYNDASAIPNLARFVNRNTGLSVNENEERISLSDERLFSFPFLFLTGHGRISLTGREVTRLRKYLLSGGFLYADDDYGLDKHFREIMKKVFPSRDFHELPFSHPIFNIHFKFDSGLPKIHEHDNKAPQGFGLFDDSGRLMVFYTYESNLADGWADADVHQSPVEKREAALKMGSNILIWAILH